MSNGSVECEGKLAIVCVAVPWAGRIVVRDDRGRQLQPLTNALYALIENDFPEDIRYRIRGAIAEDLGQRSLFLLLLTATVELALYSLFKLMKGLIWRRSRT